jgi:hypothetical protein
MSQNQPFTTQTQISNVNELPMTENFTPKPKKKREKQSAVYSLTRIRKHRQIFGKT